MNGKGAILIAIFFFGHFTQNLKLLQIFQKFDKIEKIILDIRVQLLQNNHRNN